MILVVVEVVSTVRERMVGLQRVSMQAFHVVREEFPDGTWTVVEAYKEYTMAVGESVAHRESASKGQTMWRWQVSADGFVSFRRQEEKVLNLHGECRSRMQQVL